MPILTFVLKDYSGLALNQIVDQSTDVSQGQMLHLVLLAKVKLKLIQLFMDLFMLSLINIPLVAKYCKNNKKNQHTVS